MSCAPACAPPTRRCSSCRRSTAWTPPPPRCGRSAPPSACPARSPSPGSTTRAPTSTRRVAHLPATSSATACCRSTCRCSATTASAAVGLIGLLTQRVFDYSAGYPPAVRDPDPQHLPAIEESRNELIEGIIAESEDETLMDRYLAGEDIETDVLIEDLEKAVARGTFYPVCRSARETGLGPRRAARGADQRRSRRRSSTPLPPVTDVDGSPRAPLTLRPGRARWSPRWSRRRSTRTSAGSPWSGSSPARCARSTPVHISGHGMAERGHPDHDADERVAHLFSPLGAHAARGAATASPATSARSPSRPRPRPATRISAKDDPLLIGAVGHARAAAAGRDRRQDPLRRGRPGQEPRPAGRRRPDAAAGAQRRRPTSWCCGAWARRTPTWCWTGCASGGVELDTEPVRVALRETFAAPPRATAGT